MCYDTDKSRYLAVTNTQISSWVANLEERKILLQVRYTIANEEAGSVMLRVFSPGFSQLYEQQGLPAAQGQHETDPLEITMPEGSAGFGTYGAVVYAMETQAAGEEYNRDGEPKPAVQGVAHNLFVLCDVDVDSDANDWHKDPGREPAEDEVEMVSPGKIVMRNEDDDDQN